MNSPELSLILPCYNEGEHFLSSISQVVTSLQESKLKYEIIFVEDNSSDRTISLIEWFMKKNRRIPASLIKHVQNQGRGKSVSDGFIKARGQFVGYIDIDCEVSPMYIGNFVKALQDGADVVCANRQYIFALESTPRWLASTFYRFISRVLLQHPFNDTESGYKFFRKKTIIPLLKQIKNQHWFWDTEIMLYSLYEGLRVYEINVLFNRKPYKTSTVRLIPDAVIYFKELLRFRRTLKQKYLSQQ